MHRSNTFDFFGHIREELPDLQTELIDLFKLPQKRTRKRTKREVRDNDGKEKRAVRKEKPGIGKKAVR